MQWVVSIMEDMGYTGIMLLILFENVFPPIPSEVILPFAGFLVSQGSFHLWGVLASSTLGAVLGALFLYAVGRAFGINRIYAITRKYGRILTVKEENVRQSELWFQRYGIWTVFFCRLVPILRSIISIPAGLANMELPIFILFTALGTFLWNFVLVMFGYALGAAWPVVMEWVGLYQNLLLVIGFVVAFLILMIRWKHP